MANIFTQNPMRVDTTMASDYLTTIGASAGLERPIKVTKLLVEETGAVTAGAITVTDAGGNLLWEVQVATVAAGSQTPFNFDFASGSLLWRTFKLTAIPANCVLWIYRR